MGTEPGLQTILTTALMAGVEGAESFTFFLGVWTQAWSWLIYGVVRLSTSSDLQH